MKVYVVMFDYFENVAHDYSIQKEGVADSSDISDIFYSYEKAVQYIDNHELGFKPIDESDINYAFYYKYCEDDCMTIYASIEEWEVK